MNLLSLFKRKARPMITQASIASALNQFNKTSNCKIRFADSIYGCVSREEGFKFARNSARLYTTEVSDCDDAAWMFKAEAIKAAFHEKYPLACGVAWMPSHAVSFCIDSSSNVHVFDGTYVAPPQVLPEEVNLILL